MTVRGPDGEITLAAPYVIDATELGDLLELAGVEHVDGSESRGDTGELHAIDGPAQRLDGGTGYPGLRPRGDLLGTIDELALRPYIRESRRIRAEFTVLEEHVGVEARQEARLPAGSALFATASARVPTGSTCIPAAAGQPHPGPASTSPTTRSRCRWAR